jgi:hypothetical protein
MRKSVSMVFFVAGALLSGSVAYAQPPDFL